jgi:beta-alanine degradation protein BauB
METTVMKIKYLKLAGIAAFSVLSASAVAAESGQSSHIPVTQLHYSATGVSDGVHGELNAAPAYGDLGHGPHGTFIKMPAGFVSPVHTHTDDYWGVVISGVAVNGKPGSTDVQLPVGSYWFQKGGEAHVTKCVSPNECIFFISQGGKFDYIPVKQGAMPK